MSTSMPDSISTATTEPSPRLYTPGQVALATFLGGPAGGGWLIRANCRRLDQPERGRLVISCAIAATLALFAWGILDPGNAAISRLIAPGSAALMHQLGRVMFPGRFGPNQAKESWGRAFGVGLAVMAVTLATAFILTSAASNGPPWMSDPINDRITIGPEQHVEYASGATVEDGRRLAAFLRAHETFGRTPASALLTGAAGHRGLMIPVGDGAWDDPETISSFTDLGHQIRTELFPGESLTVHIGDIHGISHRDILVVR